MTYLLRVLLCHTPERNCASAISHPVTVVRTRVHGRVALHVGWGAVAVASLTTHRQGPVVLGQRFTVLLHARVLLRVLDWEHGCAFGLALEQTLENTSNLCQNRPINHTHLCQNRPINHKKLPDCL